MDDPLAQPRRQSPADLGPLFAAPAPPPTPADLAPAPPPIPPARDPTPTQHRILAALGRLGGRGAIWQVAETMRLPDHCISQRFSEMVANGHLLLTADTNRRPVSNKLCKIYQLLQPSGDSE